MPSFASTDVPADVRSSRAGILAGQIASVQMGSGGNPEWLQTGIWVLRGLPAANSTEAPDLDFIARMTMVVPNGTALHGHRVYGFQPTGFKTDGNLLLINRTANVTMREGPVPAVPLNIAISNMTTVAITIGPEKVESHFGNDPIYGIVSDASRTSGKQEGAEIGSRPTNSTAADLYGGRVATESSTAQQLSGSVRNNSGAAIENLNAAVDYLSSQGNVDSSKIASLGWCFGGGQSLQLALNSDRPLAATVIYYGNLVTDQQQLSKITWPVLGIFGSADQSIPVSSVKQFDASLDANGTPNEIYIYEGVGHAFANSSGDNYAPRETQDAWQKTLAFLDRHL
jgi:dienelactone hydrolase